MNVITSTFICYIYFFTNLYLLLLRGAQKKREREKKNNNKNEATKNIYIVYRMYGENVIIKKNNMETSFGIVFCECNKHVQFIIAQVKCENGFFESLGLFFSRKH